MILVDIVPCGQKINWDLYIETLETLQTHFRWIWPQKNGAGIFLQHDHAWPHIGLKTQEAMTKPRFSPVWEPSLLPSMGKGLVVKTVLLNDCFVGCTYKIQIGTRGDRFSFLLLQQGCWSWWRLYIKMECVIHPSNHSMSVCKELYDKLLAIKKLLCKTYWSGFVYDSCMSKRWWVTWCCMIWNVCYCIGSAVFSFHWKIYNTIKDSGNHNLSHLWTFYKTDNFVIVEAFTKLR
jgi:hypothetical protein